ncbi:hypothetical protein FGIG_12100 [Fasciola gigantica]|uniref:Uncharacterized protein n=1 Tax=Fasciola gigantica TaxID=46835 RepID=A0A504Z7F4_FASGI|nr:hypothetical protein FGIG_12100 [Fasciola gigantica]
MVCNRSSLFLKANWYRLIGRSNELVNNPSHVIQLALPDNVGAEVITTSGNVYRETENNRQRLDRARKERDAPESVERVSSEVCHMNEATEAVTHSITRNLVGCRSEQARETTS